MTKPRIIEFGTPAHRHMRALEEAVRAARHARAYDELADALHAAEERAQDTFDAVFAPAEDETV